VPEPAPVSSALGVPPETKAGVALGLLVLAAGLALTETPRSPYSLAYALDMTLDVPPEPAIFEPQRAAAARNDVAAELGGHVIRPGVPTLRLGGACSAGRVMSVVDERGTELRSLGFREVSCGAPEWSESCVLPLFLATEPECVFPRLFRTSPPR
jgi:hypothetical protein